MIRTKPIPYVGLTDVPNAEYSQELLKLLRKHRKPGSKRRVMIGVMMSFKTLHDLKTEWADVWIPKEKIAEVFVQDEDAMNTIHYADYAGKTSVEDLFAVIRFCGSNLHAIQLDMIWPSPEILAIFHKAYPYTDIVLQVGAKAFRALEPDPKKEPTPKQLIEKLREYPEGVLRYVLLDKSGGTGTPLNADEMLPYILAVRGEFPFVGIALAGGLGPATLRLLKNLPVLFPDISTDAQGKLRPKGQTSKDPLDTKMGKRYLAGILKRFV